MILLIKAPQDDLAVAGMGASARAGARWPGTVCGFVVEPLARRDAPSRTGPSQSLAMSRRVGRMVRIASPALRKKRMQKIHSVTPAPENGPWPLRHGSVRRSVSADESRRASGTAHLGTRSAHVAHPCAPPAAFRQACAGNWQQKSSDNHNTYAPWMQGL